MVTNDLDGKPFQLKFVRPAQMMLFANVICDPPLGQITLLPEPQDAVDFTVLLESSRSFPEQSWEVVLWHNCHDASREEWRELALQDKSDAVVPLAISSHARPWVYRRYFSGKLVKPTSNHDPVQFTLKFRLSSSDSWKWVNDQSCLKDGELFFQAAFPSKELDHYFEAPLSHFNVHSVPSDVPDTQLWSLSSSVPAASIHTSAYSERRLGKPANFSRWFSLVRIWSPWLAPRHGQSFFNPTEDAVLSSFLRRDGLHLVLLAVSGIEDVLTVFKPDGEGNIMISARNDSTEKGQAVLIAAVGKTFEAANAAVMYHARKLIHGDEYMSSETKAEMKALIEGSVKAEWIENWYDGLTYCTWNGLGQKLQAQKIYDALDDLETNGINVTNLIIDDNWQSLDNPGASQFKRGMTDFDANKEGFPQGLKYTVRQIRSKHPNIYHIGVWHALLGYWGGISPTGSIAKKYKTREVRKAEGPAGGTFTVVDADDAQRMYDDFYRFLLDAGIDSVKTDAQFFLDRFEDAEDRRRFIKAYQDAWTISSLRYFSTKAISCMSQAPQIIFHSQLPTNKPRIMLRNSDDFFPEIPASHPWHIFTNAHNSLLTSHLNILPDWDMFQTSHPYSTFHAAGRCVSGGPIYFTDEPGKHDINLISQMTARTTKGKTVILRPTTIGKSTGIYTAFEEERLLRVGTYTGSQGTGTGILGIFNVSERTLCEFINLNEFPSVEIGKEYIVRGHTTGEISSVLKLGDEMAVMSLEVQVKGSDILSAYPIHSFPAKGKQGPTKVAVIGLLGKMTGAAAVLESEYRHESNGNLIIRSAIKALGVLGIYISNLASRSIESDFLITILGQVIPIRAVQATAENCVLEIDLESAWTEMGLHSGWSNVVSVDVIVQ